MIRLECIYYTVPIFIGKGNILNFENRGGDKLSDVDAYVSPDITACKIAAGLTSTVVKGQEVN